MEAVFVQFGDGDDLSGGDVGESRVVGAEGAAAGADNGDADFFAAAGAAGSDPPQAATRKTAAIKITNINMDLRRLRRI